MASVLPLVLMKALEYLPDFMNSDKILYNCPGNVGTRIRADKLANLISGICALIRCACLQHGGLFCLITEKWARPITVVEFSRLAGFSERTGARVLEYLRAMEWIEGTQIKRKNAKTGAIEVSAGIRKFTDKFWADIGLSELFAEGVEWAKKNANRTFILPFRRIKTKVKEAAQSVGNLVKTTVAMLENDAARVKFHCDRIRAMLERK